MNLHSEPNPFTVATWSKHQAGQIEIFISHHMVSHLPFVVKGQAPFAFLVPSEHPLLLAWACWTLPREPVTSKPGRRSDGSITSWYAPGQYVHTLSVTWSQNYFSTSHRAPALCFGRGYSSLTGWWSSYLGKCGFCLCCDLFLRYLDKDWLLCYCWYYLNTNRHPFPSIKKLQNQLLDSHLEVLLSRVCDRETEAWQAWVTSTRSYTPVGVLGIKPRSFWRIETQAYISYRLGRLRMLSSPSHPQCATETAFVLPNLHPNVSNITSAVNSKTRIWSLWSPCPAGMWLLLLTARLDFLWSWVFAKFDQGTGSVWTACPDIFSCLLSITETLLPWTLITRRPVCICFYQKCLILIIITSFTLC